MMAEEESDWGLTSVFILFILFAGTIVEGDTPQKDKEILLSLKSFLEKNNQVNRGKYSQWAQKSQNPCNWPGIFCTASARGSRVTGVDLSRNSLSGEIFSNFSMLTELTDLDLSSNTLSGEIPESLSRCTKLKYLNLSHNILEGELNLTGLISIQSMDLSMNRIWGGIQHTFPAICSSLKVINVSTNNFTGSIDGCFDECWELEHLDLSANNFTGEIWGGFGRLKRFSVSGNKFFGSIFPSFLNENCSLEILDLSENGFLGEFPSQISNCRNLSVLNLSTNKFTGEIPASLGSVPGLEALILGSNNFSREIPESLLNCSKLIFLDLSRNELGGEIPVIIGRFRQVKCLVLHGNFFTKGIYSSGILNLPNIWRLDLSFNNFTGPLPPEFSKMVTLQFLVLAYNNFSGKIPVEYGSLPQLQALDLSFNNLSGSIPSSLGNLTSLLWLMLANNSLTGEIPPQLGNCSSLLWLNLANNKLYGRIPPELTNIGSNPIPTFLSNRNGGKIVPGSGECLQMRRWIPANYPPFSFVYTLLTRKSCRSIWDRILKGYGLFPICQPGTNTRTLQISGYLQLSGNRISGEIPAEIGKMHNFSMLHFGANEFDGALPPDIGKLPLVVLNVSKNGFSGEIPSEIGNIKCLENLDLSSNNFSGIFPVSLNGLGELSKFNVSFNPLISGVIPSTGQLATFERDSFLGDPLLVLPSFINASTNSSSEKPRCDNTNKCKRTPKLASFIVFLIMFLAFLTCGLFSLLICNLLKHPTETSRYLLKGSKYRNHLASSSSSTNSSPWLSDTIKVIQLDKTTFTYADILKATGNFSENRVLGRGGYGAVYRGVLPDGRQVAVKKLQSKGTEGEKEFRAEMEVLSQNGIGWPHPNLVTLYGWCLDGSEKILVYEYMEGGTLEDMVTDPKRLRWKRRLEIAIDVAKALVFLHHECYPPIVHRDVKASNVLLDKEGKARVTDFGLARVVDVGQTHVSTTVAGTVGYVAPEYGQTWQATTKGDVYSFGVLAMELATARRAVDGGEECLVEWARRVIVQSGLDASVAQTLLTGSGLEGALEMGELLMVGIKCTAEAPQARPNMKEVLSMLIKILGSTRDPNFGSQHC